MTTDESKSQYPIPKSISSANISFELDGQRYQWSGGFGAVLTSHERWVKRGDVRMIGGILFYAFMVFDEEDYCWQKRKIGWSIPNEHITVEWIRELKQAIFGS